MVATRIRGRKWMTIRERIMSRDCGLCQQCKRQGRIKQGTQVDHIIALTNNGSNDDDNLECICPDCHLKKNMVDLGFKPQITTGIDGWPTESNHRNIRAIWRMDGYK